ncbi:MAG TPA: regulatory protein RecX [Candidatus Eremiobacteraceae bacterium]|nr:regulatory protein RecX [Candidatus Eremiobacteraceae bacterium]
MDGQQGVPSARPGGSTIAAAVRLLSGRRMTRAQLAQKLRDRGHAADAIDAALAECERRKYLDDRTYAQLRVKSVLDRKAVGRLRLYQELVRNGVDGDLAREVLDELEDNEDARIERALAKLEAMRPADGYAQLGRRLERLGFGAPSIARALRRSAEDRGDMPDRMEALE